MLDDAVKLNPDAWRWIKADGVDVVKGLGESTRGVWWGDVDLDDGHLQELQQQASEQLKFVSRLGLDNCADPDNVLVDLEAILDFTKNDCEFLHDSKTVFPS